MRFKDHFSGHSTLYSRYRPDYPPSLYRFLAEQAPQQELAWDCATGSGQAALGLAEHFSHVIATDASAAQLKQATPHPRVEYLVAPAEQVPLADHSVDLITVAQALHWFDLDGFYHEVRRVLRPDGVLAVWSYNLLQCEPAIDAVLNHFYAKTIGPWWPPERVHIENGYQDLAFPFTEEKSPDFAMQAQWSLPQLSGYLRTWSAVQRYQKEQGVDPVTLIEAGLAELWGEAEQVRIIRWPLSLRWGRPFPSVSGGSAML